VDYLVSNAGVAELEQLLSYHLVNGVIPSSSLAVNSPTTVASVQGSDLNVVKSADGKVKVNGIATVETPDVVSTSIEEWEIIVSKKNRSQIKHSISHHHIVCFYSISSFFSWRVMALSISLIQSWFHLREREFTDSVVYQNSWLGESRRARVFVVDLFKKHKVVHILLSNREQLFPMRSLSMMSF
jgi:hypothetical protein